jgi:aromatic-L-amino-acid decarboxylase
VPFSTVCFRARGDDDANRRLLAAVNADGRFLLSHTVLGGRFTLRVAIGNLRTTEAHLDALWELLVAEVAEPGAPRRPEEARRPQDLGGQGKVK